MTGQVLHDPTAVSALMPSGWSWVGLAFCVGAVVYLIWQFVHDRRVARRRRAEEEARWRAEHPEADPWSVPG